MVWGPEAFLEEVLLGGAVDAVLLGRWRVACQDRRADLQPQPPGAGGRVAKPTPLREIVLGKNGWEARYVTCQEVVECVHEVHPGPVVRDVVGNVQAFLPIDIRPQGHPWRESTTHLSPFPLKCWLRPSHLLWRWWVT